MNVDYAIRVDDLEVEITSDYYCIEGAGPGGPPSIGYRRPG